MVDYNGEFLFPPRPENAIPPAMLGFWQKKGWIAQIKKNGACCVIVVGPRTPLEPTEGAGRSVSFYKRDGSNHELWTPSPETIEPFASIDGDGAYVFVAELLHSKVKDGPKDTLYLHDCLVADGEYLIGSTYAERYTELCWAFRHLPFRYGFDDVRIAPRLFILANHSEKFKTLYNGLTNPEDEGLVLKDPNAKLKLCDRESANSDGMVKCRKGTKNFSY